MSGLEVVALVPSIISAWCAVAVEYRSWRKRRAKRASEQKNSVLQTHLQSIAPMLNSQFQEHFRRGGGAFQRGDGKLVSFKREGQSILKRAKDKEKTLDSHCVESKFANILYRDRNIRSERSINPRPEGGN